MTQSKITMDDVWKSGAKPKPAPDIDYSGFPIWCVLVTEPNREQKAADWLKRVNVHVYLPMFSKRVGRPRGRCAFRQYAVLPGLLFVPAEMIQIDNRDEVFDWARVRGFLPGASTTSAKLSKADVERIRRIEAKLNHPEHPVDARAVEIKPGSHIRFLDRRDVSLFGEGTVFEVAHERRIGVEVAGLFGRTVRVYVPATEIEVM